MRKNLKKAAAMAAVLVVCSFSAMAEDPTDITGVAAKISDYWALGLGIGVPVILWGVGRMVFKKGTRG